MEEEIFFMMIFDKEHTWTENLEDDSDKKFLDDLWKVRYIAGAYIPAVLTLPKAKQKHPPTRL